MVLGFVCLVFIDICEQIFYGGFVTSFSRTSEKRVFSGHGVVLSNRPMGESNRCTLTRKQATRRWYWICLILSVVHQLAFSSKWASHRYYNSLYCLLKTGIRTALSEFQNCWETPALGEFSTNDSGALLKVLSRCRCAAKGFKRQPHLFCGVSETLGQVVIENIMQ